MKLLIIPAIAVAGFLGTATFAPAQAGCLTGAAVGAVAGHYAGHHALLGAGAGCVVGHHVEARREDRAYEPGADYAPPVDGYQRPSYVRP